MPDDDAVIVVRHDYSTLGRVACRWLLVRRDGRTFGLNNREILGQIEPVNENCPFLLLHFL
jgi:hypothetical protein